MVDVVADLQRMRRRRNQCSSVIVPSTTQRYAPRPEPCPGITAVGVRIPGAAQGLAALAADRRDGLDQRDQLGDVIAVAAGW